MAESIETGAVTMRTMNRGDIPLGMRLKSIAGWNQVEADWEMLLDAGGKNYVASLEGRDVGTVTTVPFSSRFTWIGMLLVDPAARRKGIGTALLNRAIQACSTYGQARLDATADGFALYQRTGFRREYELLRLVRTAAPWKEKNTRSCKPVSHSQWSAVPGYDAPAFGADRRYILDSLYERNPEYAMAYTEDQAIQGYCLGRSGSRYQQIGPVVADKEEIARELITGVLKRCALSDVVVDAFSDKPGWIRFLEEIGFIRQRNFIRMCLGELKYPGITNSQYAIAGPEIG